MFGKVVRRILPKGGGYAVTRYVMRMADLRQRGRVRSAKLISAKLSQKHGVYLSALAEIPATTRLPHPTAIVVGDGVKLADNVTIYQNVTLGGARKGDWQAGNYPSIGQGTTIFAGAVIVGAVTVGAGCVIGANSVVTNDVPDGATAVGAPARVIRHRATGE